MFQRINRRSLSSVSGESDDRSEVNKNVVLTHSIEKNSRSFFIRSWRFDEARFCVQYSIIDCWTWVLACVGSIGENRRSVDHTEIVALLVLSKLIVVRDINQSWKGSDSRV